VNRFSTYRAAWCDEPGKVQRAGNEAEPVEQCFLMVDPVQIGVLLTETMAAFYQYPKK
jgi:hypothetical protein